MNPMLDFLGVNGAEWIRSQREIRRPQAAALPEAVKSSLRLYFPADVLESARVATTPEIPNPTFYAQLRANPLDFRVMDVPLPPESGPRRPTF
jgi:hypothetical protein